MNRRRFVTGTGAGLTVILAGCLSSAQESDDDQSGTEQPVEPDDGSATVEVSGSGTVDEDPDMASFRVAVESSRSSADDVRTELAEDSEALIDALLDAGIDEDDITTERYDIRDHRQRSGYEGTHAYRVDVYDVDAVGEIIDVAVEAGADDVGRVQFSLSEAVRDELRSVALERALDDARRDAEIIASAKGVEIVGVVTVSTQDTDVQPFRGEYLALTDAEDDAASTEIQDGPVTVSAHVNVVYAIG